MLSQNISDRISPSEFEPVRKKWERRGITSWDLETLPDAIDVKGAGNLKWIVFPGLEENPGNPKSVNLRLFERRDRAMAAHKKGVAALYGIYFSKDLKFLKRHLTLPPSLRPAAEYFGGKKNFEKNMSATVTDTLFSKNIRTRNAFYSHAESIAHLILKKGRELMCSVIPVLEVFLETLTGIEKMEAAHRFNQTTTSFFDGLRNELGRLVPDNFMQIYEPNRLVCLDRYIKSISVRAERALINFDKDRSKAEAVEIFSAGLNELLARLTASASEGKRKALEEFFWMIEEYKVSVFAQELGTAFPVSRKRLEKKLEELKRMR